jgi:NFU1 iron-sulfur cluster scaffold homolog, mitochondrial
MLAVRAALRGVRRLFIETQSTPNPNSLKFLPGRDILKEGTVNFAHAKDATKSPLAKDLFRVTGVKGVMFGKDFVTVTKEDDVDTRWIDLKPMV